MNPAELLPPGHVGRSVLSGDPRLGFRARRLVRPLWFSPRVGEFPAGFEQFRLRNGGAASGLSGRICLPLDGATVAG
jgi:hypothetical protein